MPDKVSEAWNEKSLGSTACGKAHLLHVWAGNAIIIVHFGIPSPSLLSRVGKLQEEGFGIGVVIKFVLELSNSNFVQTSDVFARKKVEDSTGQMVQSCA